MRRVILAIAALVLVGSIAVIGSVVAFADKHAHDGYVGAKPAAVEVAKPQSLQQTLTEVGELLGKDRLALARQLVVPAITVTLKDKHGNPITSIARGEPLIVSATHSAVSQPRYAAILILPTTNPALYPLEMKMYIRHYNGIGVIGANFDFTIPPEIHIQGWALVLVLEESLGGGWAVIQVSP